VNNHLHALFASAIRADSKEASASWQVTAALGQAELGKTTSARQGVAAALALSPGRNVKVLAASRWLGSAMFREARH